MGLSQTEAAGGLSRTVLSEEIRLSGLVDLGGRVDSIDEPIEVPGAD